MSPFAIPNVRRLIAFHVLFSCRFYYPIFTILFLDYGLTLGQFAILNSIWAATIVLAEIPSGALADLIGRKRLVRAAAFFMAIEMALIAFVPLGNGTLIFTVFAVNRILSGLAEASASGADEALAYDSLARDGDIKDWPKILEWRSRLRSIGFIVAMGLGPVLYDVHVVNTVIAFFGFDLELAKETTIRFPLIATLLLAIGAIFVSLRIEDVETHEVHGDEEAALEAEMAKGKGRVEAAWDMIVKAGRWVFTSPFPYIVILAALVFDAILRYLITLKAEYMRIIGWPEATLGLFALAGSFLGIFMPRVCRWLVETKTPQANLTILFVVTLVITVGTAMVIPWWGFVFAMFIGTGLELIYFFSSHYLNQAAPSRMRATILSFRGLALNLGYGLMGLAYAGAMIVIKQDLAAEDVTLAADPGALQVAAFSQALSWFIPAFLVLFGALLLIARVKLRGVELPKPEKSA